MEGLDVTILSLQNFRDGNKFLRLDSEFSEKNALHVIQNLRDAGAEQFGKTDPKIIHPHEIVREYVEDAGVWFFRAQNLRPMAIEPYDKVFISADDAQKLARNWITNGDIVITRTGANAGDCALFHSDVPALASSHTFIIRSDAWNHSYLVAFFNSSYGRAQILRGRYGAAQPEVAPYYLRGLWIPRFSEKFSGFVQSCLDLAYSSRAKADEFATKAEIVMLGALDLAEWKPPAPLTYTASASQALFAARIDSDFFSPARLETLKKLAETPHRLIGDFCKSVRVLLNPLKPGEVAEVRNFDLSDALKPALDDTKEIVPVGQLGSAKKVMRKGDVVISRLRSYLRQIAVVRTSKSVPTVGSSEFIVLRPDKELDPELLMVFLRSMPVQTILSYCQEGNQHPRYSEDNLLSIPFPLALLDHKEEIISHIRIAHAARAEAKRLLDLAIHAVETAIEEGEQAAMKLLKLQTGL